MMPPPCMFSACFPGLRCAGELGELAEGLLSEKLLRRALPQDGTRCTGALSAEHKAAVTGYCRHLSSQHRAYEAS